MSYPSQKHFDKEREDFFKNGGPEFVRRQILALDSITKHKETGQPWPAFHRCSICGQHPEPMGKRCLKIGEYHNIPLCEYCVTEMYKALKNEV